MQKSMIILIVVIAVVIVAVAVTLLAVFLTKDNNKYIPNSEVEIVNSYLPLFLMTIIYFELLIWTPKEIQIYY